MVGKILRLIVLFIRYLLGLSLILSVVKPIAIRARVEMKHEGEINALIAMLSLDDA